MKKRNKKYRSCKGIPGKGGKSFNYQIPDYIFKRELEEYRAEQAKKKEIS